MTGEKLKGIDFNNGNLLPNKNIDIGFAAENKNKKLRITDTVNLTQINNFQEGAQRFVINILLKLFERSPLGSVLLRRSAVLNPVYALSVTKEELKKMLNALRAHLIDIKILSPTTCDTVDGQFSMFLGNKVKLNKQKCENFDPKKNSFGHFLFPRKYKELSFVVRLILTLRHGQSAVERGFSLRGNLAQNNQEEDTIVSRRIIKDYSTSSRAEPYNVCCC